MIFIIKQINLFLEEIRGSCSGGGEVQQVVGVDLVLLGVFTDLDVEEVVSYVCRRFPSARGPGPHTNVGSHFVSASAGCPTLIQR